MKKAINITGILWTLALIGGMFACIGLGAFCFMALESAKDLAEIAKSAQITLEEAKNVVPMLGGMLICAGVLYLVGAVLCIVMTAKRNSNMSKGAGIALGVFGILTGGTLPGLLFIIDSAKTRQ